METQALPEPRIYLDHAATTLVLPAARAAMAEALERWHNPSSPHAEGRAAKAALENARDRIRAALGWNGKLIFTSGASEALAIALRRTKAARTFVSAVEHDAVFRAAPSAARLTVGVNGIVQLPELERGDLIAVQHANNETGILQPVEDIVVKAGEAGAILLCDCAQTAGKLALPDADILVVSGHKFGGPPGVGALLLRDFGLVQASGGQEQGYRGGTENLPAILGMAAALEAERDWTEKAGALRLRLEDRVVAAGGEVIGTGSPRISTIGAYRMPGMASNTQLIRFDLGGIAVSAGSACASGSLKPSHVLAAMGMDEKAAGEVVRVSFGPQTSEAEVDRFADQWRAMAEGRQAPRPGAGGAA